MREQVIQRAIMDWLDSAGIVHWRVHLGAVRVKGARIKNPMRGFPDLAGVLPNSPGRLFVIEVKQEDGRFNVDQVRWKDKLAAVGVTYIIATSVEDVALGIKGQTIKLEKGAS